MSGEVDDRVVSIEFDNAVFERRLEATLTSLDKLTQALQFDGAKRGVSDISQTMNGFDTSHMASAIDSISSKFSALGIAGITVISNLTTSVLDFVKKTASSIIDPIFSGGRSRALAIEQAKFQFQGLGIDVNKAMDSALKAVQGTAFGLDEAAKTAAQFGASGIKAGDQMTAALRGVAGAAAMTGSSFSEISDIFTSSAGTGVVNNQDLQQFGTRGLNAAAAIAPILGKTEKQVHEMASKGQLDFQTFADAMDKAFGKHATEADKTFTGALANMHAAMSRLGAAILAPQLENQRKLFNALSPVIDKVKTGLMPLIDVFSWLSAIKFNHIIDFVNHLDLRALSGMPALAQAFARVVGLVHNLLTPIGVAFHSIFSPNLTVTILHMIAAFSEFSKHLRLTMQTSFDIRRAFAGLFAILDIGFAVVKGVAGVLIDLVKGLAGVTGNTHILTFFANLGDSLVALDKSLVAGGKIKDFFDSLGTYIRLPLDAIKDLEQRFTEFFDSSGLDIHKPIEALKALQQVISDFFSGGISKPEVIQGAADSVANLTDRFQRLHDIADRLNSLWDNLMGGFDRLKKTFDTAWGYISNWMHELGHNIAQAIGGPGAFDSAVDTINVGLLGGIIVLLKKFLDGGLGSLKLDGGVIKNINDVLDTMNSKFKTMQTQIKADTLLKIAEAMALLTVSAVALSLVNSVALTKAMTAMAVGFGELAATMKILDSIASNTRGAAKLTLLAAALDMMAGALVIMAGAVLIFSKMNPAELATGLVGVTASLLILVGATKLIDENGPGLLVASVAMGAMAVGLTLMAGAVLAFGSMPLGELAKGLGAVAIALGIIGIAMNLFPIGGTIAAGLAMIPLAIGLTILGGAVKIFGSMPLGEMAKGLGGIAVALGIIAAMMGLMPLDLPLTAAGLILVGIGLTGIAGAVALMGAIKMGELAKGIGAIAITLGILAVGLTVMSGTLGGSAALLVAAVSLGILADVIEQLGKIPIAQLVTGIVAVAVVLGVLGVAAALLTPVIPEMLALGVALGLLGVSFALFGVGAMFVAKAFQVMAEAGVAGTKALIESMQLIAEALPKILAGLVVSLLQDIQDVIDALPLLVKVIVAVLGSLLDALIVLVPKVAQLVEALVMAMLDMIRAEFPAIMQTGIELLLQFIVGLTAALPDLISAAVNLITVFSSTIAQNALLLTDAAVSILLSFLTAISDRIGDITAAGMNLLLNFLLGIADNLDKVIETATQIVENLVVTIASSVHRLVDLGVAVVLYFIAGIENNLEKIVSAAVNLVIRFVNSIADNTVKLANAGADALISFLNGLSDAIDTKAPEIRKAGERLAGAIIDGATGGLASKAGGVVDKIGGIFSDGIKAAKGVIQSNSPSRVFFKIGQDMIAGTVLALDQDHSAQDSVVSHAERIVAAFAETLGKVPASLPQLGDIQPTITPVLDLSKVQEGAGQLNDLMKVAAITPDVSLQNARLISTTAEEAAVPTDTTSSGPTQLSFTQINNSPKALSAVDIYRDSKSLIARAKEELNI